MFLIQDLQQDIRHIATKISEGVESGLVLCSKYASAKFSTDFIHNIYSEKGKAVFTCKKNTIGHTQHGLSPSVFDRRMGIKMAAKYTGWFSEKMDSGRKKDGSVFCNDPSSVLLLGLRGGSSRFTPVSELEAETNPNQLEAETNPNQLEAETNPNWRQKPIRTNWRQKPIRTGGRNQLE